jgi:hypothetical protein
MFSKGISEWLTYRENSTFIASDTSIAIKVDCGTTYKSLLYALLHEASHIIDYELHITPYVEKHFKDIPNRRNENAFTPFVEGVWQDYNELKKDYDFSLRKDITVFGFGNGPKIPILFAQDVYRSFSKIPIASIYGSTCWAEDFADFVMAYHLSVNLGQPFTITYSKNGNVVYEIEPMRHENIEKRFLTINYVFSNKD